MNWKAGDKVVCIDATLVWWLLTEGRQYTVAKVDPPWLYLHEIAPFRTLVERFETSQPTVEMSHRTYTSHS